MCQYLAVRANPRVDRLDSLQISSSGIFNDYIPFSNDFGNPTSIHGQSIDTFHYGENGLRFDPPDDLSMLAYYGESFVGDSGSQQWPSSQETTDTGTSFTTPSDVLRSFGQRLWPSRTTRT